MVVSFPCVYAMQIYEWQGCIHLTNICNRTSVKQWKYGVDQYQYNSFLQGLFSKTNRQDRQ